MDGVAVTGGFFERLVSFTITDREGVRADSLQMVFEDAPPHIDAPRRGGVLSLRIAGQGGGFIGAYVIDQVSYSCLPYTITVKGHSADLRAGMKASRTLNWEDISVHDLVAQKARDHGVVARIAPAVSDHVYPWIAQQDESDLQFLERLARRHGAFFTIKNGHLLWLRRGSGETATGEAIATAWIGPGDVIEGSLRMSESDVARVARIKAYWQDYRGAARRSVTVVGDPEGQGEHALRAPFASQSEARRAAEAYARDMMRGRVETGCVILGRADVMAGQPMQYRGIRPEVDGRAFVLDQVTHAYTKSGGLRSTLSARLGFQEDAS